MNTHDRVPIGGACKFWLDGNGRIAYGSECFPITIALFKVLTRIIACKENQYRYFCG